MVHRLKDNGLPPWEAKPPIWVMTSLVAGSLKVNPYNTAPRHAGHAQDEEAGNQTDMMWASTRDQFVRRLA